MVKHDVVCWPPTLFIGRQRLRAQCDLMPSQLLKYWEESNLKEQLASTAFDLQKSACDNNDLKALKAELVDGLEQCLSRINPKSKDTWDLKAILMAKSLITKASK